jgi:hypothetical protein
MNNNQGQTNLKPIVINGLFLLLGGLLGGLFTYLGTKASAEAQIVAAQEAAKAQITSAAINIYGPIFTTQTVEARLTERAPYIPPTPIPSSTSTEVTSIEQTPMEVWSDAIKTMNKFYSWINDAGNKDDLLKSWNLETSGPNGFQCREAAGCEFVRFRDIWWDLKVQYKLYDCGSNLVDVEVRTYHRDPLLASTPSAPFFVRYQLVSVSGELKINKGTGIEGPGADCELIVSVP